MSNEMFQTGTLWISQAVLHRPKQESDAAISAAKQMMAKYKGLHGFLKTSPVRSGDFSLVLADYRITPAVAVFIGVPGRGKPPIIEELFVAT